MAGERPHKVYVSDNVSQKFTGKIRDSETRLNHFIVRYYSSNTGTITSLAKLIRVNAGQLAQFFQNQNITLRQTFDKPSHELILQRAKLGNQPEAARVSKSEQTTMGHQTQCRGRGDHAEAVRKSATSGGFLICITFLRDHRSKQMTALQEARSFRIALQEARSWRASRS
ncbi:MAG: hypothetical protein ACR2G4_14790 [Pyrinomonadaceae bacterium]